MSRLNLDQAVACVSGFGYAVLMEANAEQLEAEIAFVVSVKAGDSILGSYALDEEEGRKFRLFKRVLQKREYADGRWAWWLQL